MEIIVRYFGDEEIDEDLFGDYIERVAGQVREGYSSGLDGDYSWEIQ